MMHAFLKDNRGAATVEMALIFMLLLLVSFGIIDMGMAYWQWTAAEKATQVAARKAVVSAFVAHGLMSFPQPTANNPFGTPCMSGSGVSKPCNVTTVVCTNTKCTPAKACDGNGGNCVNTGWESKYFTAIYNEVKAIDPYIAPENLVITYSANGLGYVGRPGGLPLTVTVTLTGMKFKFYALGVLAGFTETISMPPFTSTLIGEALCTASSSGLTQSACGDT